MGIFFSTLNLERVPGRNHNEVLPISFRSVPGLSQRPSVQCRLELLRSGNHTSTPRFAAHVVIIASDLVQVWVGS